MTILDKVTGVQSNLVSRLFHFLSEDLFRIGAWGEKHTCLTVMITSTFFSQWVFYFGPL